MRRIKNITVTIILSLALLMSYGCGQKSGHLRLEREDWADDVKTAVNDFVLMYGVDSKSPAKEPYAVFDFDNTSSIFDVEEQLAVYQLQVMAFAIEPEELREVLLADLNEPDKDLTDYGYGKGSLNDWIDDICTAYTELWKSFGPFTPQGVSAELVDEMQQDPQWREFATKLLRGPARKALYQKQA